jgi:hypothetical protein
VREPNDPRIEPGTVVEKLRCGSRRGPHKSDDNRHDQPNPEDPHPAPAPDRVHMITVREMLTNNSRDVVT